MASPGTSPLWLSEDDVEALVDPARLVASVAAGFASPGRYAEPDALRIDGTDGATGYLTVFPAADLDRGLGSAKLLAGRPANARDGIPEIDAVVALVEARRGRIVALLSARRLTAYRTAAVTAAALARLGLERAIVGLVGTGLQAETHARVLIETGVADRILVASASRGRQAARRFICGLRGGLAERCKPVETGVIAGRSDALVTLSLAAAPLPLGDLPADLVIAGIGPFYPGAHELDPAMVASADTVISDHPARLRRQWAGHPLAGRQLIGLDELFSARARAHARGHRIILSDGRAFEDNVAAIQIFEAARAAGRGLPLP